MIRNRNYFNVSIGLLAIFLLCFPVVGHSQKEGNIWYFGKYAGLDFNSGKPVELLDGQLNTTEGCATIADANGRLRFYTDGITVWGRTHKQMPNGTGLRGDPSSTQSAIIVPHPGDTNIYYVFTVAAMADTAGMCYSVVDMRENSNLGDVVQKNIKLFSRSPEKVAAVRHANERDFWVIGHEWGSNKFRVYLVNTAGLQRTPVISAVGAEHKGFATGAIGQLTAATDGSRIALTCHAIKNVELFDFDNSTGKVSNPMSFPATSDNYGVSFSPDNTKLYIANANFPPRIDQYDISSGSPSWILSTKYEVCRLANGQYIGALQIGPDGKIYIARFQKNYLSVIENPNRAGAACQFRDSGLVLKRSGTLGLPAIIQSYFLPSKISVDHTCEGDSTTFYGLQFKKDDTLSWDFGDPLSGTANTSMLQKPKHRFTQAGKYQVTRAVRRNGITRTYQDSVEIFKQPYADLPDDTILCSGQVILLKVSDASGFNYLWSNGSSKPQMLVNQPGKYWVSVSTNNGACIATDTIIVSAPDTSDISLGRDTMLCAGTAYILKPDKPVISCRWSDGSTGPSLTVTQPGIYWAEMTLPCRIVYDTVRVDFLAKPRIEFGRNGQICEGDFITLNAATPSATYLWQDGSTDSVLKVTQAGTYRVTVTNPCGQATDSIYIKMVKPPHAYLGRDTLLCLGDSVVWDLRQPDAFFKWQDGSTASRHVARHPGRYVVEVSNACQIKNAEVTVEFEDCSCYLYAPNSFSPNGDYKNDSFLISYCPNTEFLLRIYNRWGECVFESRDIRQGWDGTFKGSTVPEGLYIYTVQVRGRDKSWKTGRGQVTVVR